MIHRLKPCVLLSAQNPETLPENVLLFLSDVKIMFFFWDAFPMRCFQKYIERPLLVYINTSGHWTVCSRSNDQFGLVWSFRGFRYMKMKFLSEHWGNLRWCWKQKKPFQIWKSFIIQHSTNLVISINYTSISFNILLSALLFNSLIS